MGKLPQIILWFKPRLNHEKGLIKKPEIIKNSIP